MSSSCFALAFHFHSLVDLSLPPIMYSLPHPAEYSCHRIVIFCLVSFLHWYWQLFVFTSLPGSLICVFVHICVEDEEKREEREKREKKRVFAIFF